MTPHRVAISILVVVVAILMLPDRSEAAALLLSDIVDPEEITTIETDTVDQVVTATESVAEDQPAQPLLPSTTNIVPEASDTGADVSETPVLQEVVTQDVEVPQVPIDDTAGVLEPMQETAESTLQVAQESLETPEAELEPGVELVDPAAQSHEPVLAAAGSTVDATVETLEPVLATVKPVLDVADPALAVVDVVEPVVETLEPVLATVEPVEVVEPVLEAVGPITEAVAPLPEMLEAVMDPVVDTVSLAADPVLDLDKPVGNIVAPGSEAIVDSGASSPHANDRDPISEDVATVVEAGPQPVVEPIIPSGPDAWTPWIPRDPFPQEAVDTPVLDVPVIQAPNLPGVVPGDPRPELPRALLPAIPVDTIEMPSIPVVESVSVAGPVPAAPPLAREAQSRVPEEILTASAGHSVTVAPLVVSLPPGMSAGVFLEGLAGYVTPTWPAQHAPILHAEFAVAGLPLSGFGGEASSSLVAVTVALLALIILAWRARDALQLAIPSSRFQSIPVPPG